MLYVILTSVIVFAAVILIILVLAQNSKGGGLASGFASSNQILGVRKTTDFVEKATWGFAAFIVLLCVIVSISLSSGSKEEAVDSAIKSEVENATSTNPNVAAPAAANPSESAE